jgi:Nucleotidyl transferase AbiEii toxin, Type IV TA system
MRAVPAADPGDAFYPGLRVAMDSRIATAAVRFRLDINFGDPVTPAPRMIELPSLRSDVPPVRVLGYPIETVLAEKLATAIIADLRFRKHGSTATWFPRIQKGANPTLSPTAPPVRRRRDR